MVFGCGVDAPEESVVTDNVTCGSGVWCQETAPIPSTTMLHGVWASPSGDVFAVGDTGTIIHRVAGTWSVMSSGTTSALMGVWGSSSTNVYAVGVAGAVLQFDGTAWRSLSATTSEVDAVWGSSATDIWLAGTSAVYHSTDGSTFTKTAMSGSMLSISGTSTSDVWVTGENTYVHHWNGKAWTTVNPGAGTSTYYSVIALATNNVWTSDFMPSKETERYNGSTWTANKTGGAIFESMFPNSASDIWGVGGTKIGRWNGSAWTVTTLTGVTTQLWSVSGTTTDAWTVGDNAVIEHFTY
jgi:hypothetical protein